MPPPTGFQISHDVLFNCDLHFCAICFNFVGGGFNCVRNGHRRLKKFESSLEEGSCNPEVTAKENDVNLIVEAGNGRCDDVGRSEKEGSGKGIWDGGIGNEEVIGGIVVCQSEC